MQFYLFPFFINYLKRKFKAQFEENADPNFDWYYYFDGKDLNATEEERQILTAHFIKSLKWASVSFFLSVILGIYLFYYAKGNPGSIFTILYLLIVVKLYYNSIMVVQEAFDEPRNLWVINTAASIGTRRKLEIKSKAKSWWEFNKPVIQYFGIYFPAFAISKILIRKITPEDYPTLITSGAVLLAIIIWWIYDSHVKSKEEKGSLTQAEQKRKERAGEREWDAYQRSLEEKINGKQTRKKKKKQLKKEGKNILKSYKGPTTNK